MNTTDVSNTITDANAQSAAEVSHKTDADAKSAPDLTFGGDGTIVTDLEIIHDNQTFAVQWLALNKGTTDAPAFTDLLVIYQIPEGCSGSIDQVYPEVFNSGKDGDLGDYADGPIEAGQTGPLMQPRVGPFPAGSYRLTVTLGIGLVNFSDFNCVKIVPAD